MNNKEIIVQAIIKFLIKHYKKIGIAVGLVISYSMITRIIKSYFTTLFGSENIPGDGTIALIALSMMIGFPLIVAIIISNIRQTLNINPKGINGVKIKMNDGSFGTANWLTDKEAKSILNINTDKGVILGAKKNKIVTLPHDTFLNKNIAVVGASGSMKTRAFVKPNILQLANEGKSMVITDPKSEIYREMRTYLENKGYDVKVFNLVDMTRTNKWNPLAEIKNEIDAQVFTDVIINNTEDSTVKKDMFWENGEKNLLKALALYITEKCEPTERNLAKLYSLIANRKVYELDQLFSVLNNNSAAKMSYNIYSQSNDNIKSSIVLGLGTRLQIFQNKEVRNLTSTSDIDLTKPAKSKCAYFCVTSDMNTTFDFLAGLFFSFLFIKIIEYADKTGQKCNPEVFFLLDEFSNIGQIPDFKKKISTMRSRGVHSSMIFQNIAQLKNRYPHEAWQEILGNCDTHLFLGCNDIITAQYVSNLLGVSTIETLNENKMPGMIYESTERLNYVSSKRNLMNPDELLRLPHEKAIILLRGQKPYIVNKLDYTKLNLSKEILL